MDSWTMYQIKCGACQAEFEDEKGEVMFKSSSQWQKTEARLGGWRIGLTIRCPRCEGRGDK